MKVRNDGNMASNQPVMSTTTAAAAAAAAAAATAATTAVTTAVTTAATPATTTAATANSSRDVSGSGTKMSGAAFRILITTLENVQVPLGQLCSNLWKSSFASCSHLSIGVTIAALLQDDLLTSASQRLVAIYILYDMIVTRHCPTAGTATAIDRLVDSPLTMILFELGHDKDSRMAEQLFLSHLLTHSQQQHNLQYSHQHQHQPHPQNPQQQLNDSAAIPAQISQAPAATLWDALEGAMKSGAAVSKLNISSLRSQWTARHPDRVHVTTPIPVPFPIPNLLRNTSSSSSTSSAKLGGASSEVLRPKRKDRDPKQKQGDGAGDCDDNDNGDDNGDEPQNDGDGDGDGDGQKQQPRLEYPNRHYIPPVSGVILDSDPYSTPEPGNLHDDLGAIVSLEDFTPTFVRLVPPMLPISELRIVDPEPLHQLVWDPEMGMRQNTAAMADLRDIVSKALKSPIPESLQMRVVTLLDAHPKLIHGCGLTPKRLPDLVENNSALATKMLYKLNASKQMPSYLAAFADMDINLNSMEVVNRLSTLVRLPADFIHTYVNKCIRSCDAIQDRYSKVRMVRFVCMFLKNLLKNKTVDAQSIHIEVQEFCIENSRIREVADLFRCLKN